MPIAVQEAIRLVQGETQLSEAFRAVGVDIRPMPVPQVEVQEFNEIKSEINAIEREMKEATTARDKEALEAARQKAREYPLGYNRTKSRIGYANNRLNDICRAPAGALQLSNVGYEPLKSVKNLERI